jgi:protein-tyrosine phosphatase
MVSRSCQRAAGRIVAESTPGGGTPGLVDVHCHILPGIDDGAPDVDAALDLARTAAADGVRVIAATPHVRPDHPRVRPNELGDRCAALGERLAEAAIDLEVIAGGEVDLAWSRDASAEELALVSYGQRGGDMLVETPYGPLDGSFERDLLTLRERGYRILLAHPERSADLRDDRRRLERLVDAGLLLQLTARTLLPADDDQHRFAVELLRDGLAHVLASDAHSATGLAPADLPAAVDAARAIIGRRARWMAADVPAAILAGSALPPPACGVSRGPDR